MDKEQLLKMYAALKNYGREPNLFKMPVCRKSQYNTFGKSVRQMENETINWSFFKIPGF